jgi:hypothetical protein
MKKQLFISTLAATLLLAGCVVAPTPYYDDPVFVEPPPPRVEYPGYAPVVGYIWIGGYWNWTGHRHEWVHGRWDVPRPGHRWVAPRWERDGKHWRQQRGGWTQETDTQTLHPVFTGGAPQPPRRDRQEERRPDRDQGPAYRQERGAVPPAVQGETDGHTLHPVFTGGVPPKRDKARQPGPDADRGQREARPAPEQRQTPRVEPDQKRENRRSGRRGQDDERRAD